MSIRHKIAKFCTKISFETLPKDIVEFTKVCFMDQICIMVAGVRTYLEDYPNIAKFMKDLGGKKESSIIGMGDKIPCLNATLVNTTIGIHTHFDAVHKKTIIHLPAALFPAMIAVAERQKASGKDLILASVIGAEIMLRFGISLGASNTYKRGFHPTSVCAPLGCAVGAGKLLKLGEGELAEALSIAAVQAAGSSVWAGSLFPATLSFQVGRAAQGGVMAAMLAQMGFSGVNTIFEDARGFLRSHSENPDSKKLTERLWNRYEIKDLAFKRFAVGSYIMTSIEALSGMLHNYEIGADEIEEIIVKLPTIVMPLVGSPEYPRNNSGAINTRYILAATALMGNDIAYNMELSGSNYREDPRVVDLFKKVDVVGDPELDKIFPEKKACILGLKTKDGKQFSQRSEGPYKGDPDNPLSEEDIETKFKRVTKPILSQEKANQIITSIKRLDKLDDVSQLVDLLTA